jgi:hypothetical protein
MLASTITIHPIMERIIQENASFPKNIDVELHEALKDCFEPLTHGLPIKGRANLSRFNLDEGIVTGWKYYAGMFTFRINLPKSLNRVPVGSHIDGEIYAGKENDIDSFEKVLFTIESSGDAPKKRRYVICSCEVDEEIAMAMVTEFEQYRFNEDQINQLWQVLGKDEELAEEKEYAAAQQILLKVGAAVAGVILLMNGYNQYSQRKVCEVMSNAEPLKNAHVIPLDTPNLVSDDMNEQIATCRNKYGIEISDKAAIKVFPEFTQHIQRRKKLHEEKK